jgi:hypothetical protein
MSAPFRTSMAACFAAVAALSVGAVGFSRPDGLIERSFAQGFGSNLDPLTAASRPLLPASFDPAHLHLSSLPASGMAGPSVAVGDKITLAQRQGGSVAYEVVEVRPLPLGDAYTSGSADVSRPMLVTAIASGFSPTQTIRFIVDAASPPQGTSSRPRAL